MVAWVGECLVLAAGGWILANELTPEPAPSIWVIATGGPLQPVAAILGGWAATRR